MNMHANTRGANANIARPGTLNWTSPAPVLSPVLTAVHRDISLNIVLRLSFREVIPSAALHFQWQAVSLILRAIRTINADRINTCVLVPAPLLEIACHC